MNNPFEEMNAAEAAGLTTMLIGLARTPGDLTKVSIGFFSQKTVEADILDILVHAQVAITTKMNETIKLASDKHGPAEALRLSQFAKRRFDDARRGVSIDTMRSLQIDLPHSEEQS